MRTLSQYLILHNGNSEPGDQSYKSSIDYQQQQSW